MRTIALLLLLVAGGFAQTVSPLRTEARSGEAVTFQVSISEPADQINIYRKTGVTTTATLVGTLPVLANVWSYDWMFVMPGGSTTQYRLFAVPKLGGVLEEESNGVRVIRKK